MAEPARHLRIVGLDPDTGEIHEVDHACPNCQAMEDIVKGHARDVRAWQIRYADLARSKDEEAKTHVLWPVSVELFAFWKKTTGKRGRWSTDRFWTVHPYLAEDGLELCKLAIVGATYDPWVTTRKNQTKNLHVDWSWIFKDRDRFEEHVRKAPLEVRARLLAEREARP